MVFQQFVHERAEAVDIQRLVGAQHQAGDAVDGRCGADRAQAHAGVEVKAAYIQQFSQVDGAVVDHAYRRSAVDAGQPLAEGVEGRLIHQVALAHQKPISKTDLSLGDGLGQVVLGVRRIHQGDDAVEDVALAQFFIDKKGLGHRRRVRQAGALDHQPVEGNLAAVQAFKQQVQGFGQVGVDGAAHAAVGQGHDLHRFGAQQLGIDTGVTEFVFDHGDFQAVLGLEQVTQQGGLTGAEEAAEDGDGDGRGQRQFS